VEKTPPVKLLGNLSGFGSPESVAYDAVHKVLFLSNTNGPPGGKNDGYISKMSWSKKSGKVEVVAKRWVTGFDAPMGIAVHGDYLYVADVSVLKVVHIPSGSIEKSYKGEGVVFNDVAVDRKGRVYAADFFGNRIFRLDGGSFGPWLSSPDLKTPNGLKVLGNRLLIAAWGPDTDTTTFQPAGPGGLLSVDLATKVIKPITGSSFAGSLDGVDNGPFMGYLVTEFFQGLLLYVDRHGEVTQLAQLEQTAADLAYVEDGKIAVVPVSAKGYVAIFSLRCDSSDPELFDLQDTSASAEDAEAAAELLDSERMEAELDKAMEEEGLKDEELEQEGRRS